MRRQIIFIIVSLNLLSFFICKAINMIPYVLAEEIQPTGINLLQNASFDQPDGDRALLWQNYSVGSDYIRNSDKSYASDVFGQWSCKIDGPKGGGCFQWIPQKVKDIPNFPEYGTFTATNNIYIASYNNGKICGTYITVNYADATKQYFETDLTDSQIAANLNKWKTYSRTFTTDHSKKIVSILYWFLVDTHTTFEGEVYFDEPELKLARADSSLPFWAADKTESSPVVDGRLDDACWNSGIEGTPFVLSSKAELAGQQTQACLSYDDTNVYIFMNCKENALDPILQKMADFKAEKTAQDSAVWEDDSVEILINPDSEQSVYYRIAVNSKGTIYDARCQVDADDDKDWNSNVKVKTVVGTNAWTVEMSIPFSTFGLFPESGDRWRMNLCRREKPYNEESCWSAGGTSLCDISRFGELVFGNNAVGMKIMSLGSLRNGVNKVKVSVSNSGLKEEIITVETLVLKSNVDTKPNVERIVSLVGHGELVDLEPEYLVKDDDRYLQYQYLQNGSLLYSSPYLPILAKKPVFFLRAESANYSTDGIIYTRPLSEFYCVEGEFLYVPLVLQASLAKVEFRTAKAMIEVPDSLKLINPLSKDRACLSPAAVFEEEIYRDGFKYRRYTFEFNSQNVTFSDINPGNDVVVNPLIFKLDNPCEHVDEPKVYYRIYFNDKEETSGNVSLFLFAPFEQKIPKKTAIVNWAAANLRILFGQLGQEEKTVILESWQRTGFTIHQAWTGLPNRFAVCGDSFSPMGVCKAVKDLGLGQYLKDHPEYRAKTKGGKIIEDAISPVYLWDAQIGAPVREWIKQFVTIFVQKYPAIVWDYENSVVDDDKSIGYEQKNLELFLESYGLPRDLTFENILSSMDYRKQWIDFLCRQNANLFELWRDGLKAISKNFGFFAYSGYQMDYTYEHYGVNWDYVGEYVDQIWCGYGRPSIEVTRNSATHGRPLIGGELVWLGCGDYYDQSQIKVNLFRRLSDCGGGVMSYYDLTADGRFYKAFSQVASVSADCEEFFVNYTRDDSVEVLYGGKDNVTVLKNGQNKLVFFFNSSQLPRKFQIKMPDLPDNMTGVDYWDKTIISIIPFMEVTVPAKDVKIIQITETTVPSTGDLNNDGYIDILDLQLCVNVCLAVETEAEIVRRANVNGDESVDVLDAQEIVNKIFGE